MRPEELKRYEIIARANDGLITVQEAAQGLGISKRQVTRLKKKVKEEGANGVKHGNTGRPSPKRLPETASQQIVALRRSDAYKDSNICHFRELLSEREQINVSYTALSNLLKSKGIVSPLKRRRYKPHRLRKRKAQAGLLVQVDATPYRWFKGDPKYYALHGAIDDATGQILALYMCKNECLQGYFEMLRRCIDAFGIPVSLYADRHTIFQSPNKAKAEIDAKVQVNDTQFGRALKELGVQLIAARSPQAKGRIERLWQTLQSRLPVEFNLESINTIDSANAYLEKYIYAYNSEFAVEPDNRESMFTALDDSLNLDHILCVKEERVIDSGGVISHNGRMFKVIETLGTGIIPKGAKVSVLLSARLGVKVQYRQSVFDVQHYEKPKPVKAKQAVETATPRQSPHIPDDHYFKYGQHLFPRLVYDESDHQILDMLEDIFLRKWT